ncbi:uncharacterized protein RAG0_14211 [Rhynchosporium agropyri]|uniref:Pectinesterase n=1 Tax=Rhynchosporium agropyri TaxID=914238 RepID=A0A1E1LFY4_9HELO|nr:uncharacterized protein RAG0_14211 [Rhynchosporium agropyri]
MRASILVNGLVCVNTVWCATLEVGSGKTYATIADALAKAAEGDTISLAAGTYKEKLTIAKNNITMKGPTFPSLDPAGNKATITAATYSKDVKGNDGSVTGSRFSLYNINIANTAGNDSQAVTLAIKGSQNAFYASNILGYQDTLYAHEGSSFYGSCYVEGAVDFVFGISGQAWLQGCKIAVLKPKGTITAQGRTSADSTGYIVLDKAKIVTGPSAAPNTKGKNFLGRPYGDFSRTVFQNSDLGGVIVSEGWERQSFLSIPRHLTTVLLVAVFFRLDFADGVLLSTAFSPGQNTRQVLAAEFNNANANNGNGTRVSFASKASKAVDIGEILPDHQKWVNPKFLGVSAP